jgi:hypothetical protein
VFQALLRLLRRNRILAVILDPPADPGRREKGRPPSTNGASSFHLIWELSHPRPIVEVGATLEVRQAPSVDRLYFWALQVGFSEGTRPLGGAHLGLQFHPGYPGKTAVNFGGYDAGGTEITGSESPLTSALGNPNTRNYRWEPGRAYRLRISRSPDHGWRGSITDLETEEETVVRDLWVDGGRLTGPMVWSEVFANCDHPSVEAVWSDLQAIDDLGVSVKPSGVRANYQTLSDGGCTNTNSEVASKGYTQRTNTDRVNEQGSVLPRL